MKTILKGDIIGLDLGKKRTGVARINTNARLSQALKPISIGEANDESLVTQIAALIDQYQPCALVAGLPRGLDGQNTEQTKWVLDVNSQIKNAFDLPFFEIDEAGTTKAAEAITSSSQSIDSGAAQLILDDFIAEVERGRIKNVSL